MKRALLRLLMLSLLPQILAAEAFIKVSISPERAPQGQERILQLEVYSQTWLKRAPRYPELQIPGAKVLSPKSFGVSDSRVVDGVEYTVQSQEYRIFPHRAGAFRVPPISLQLAVAGADGGARELQLSSPAQIFTADKLTGPAKLVATELSFEQRYEGLEDGARHYPPGTIIERHISLGAEQTLALLLPAFKTLHADGGQPFELEQGSEVVALEGGRLYRQLTAVADDSNRGQYRARREEVWRYQLQHPGQYQLPPLRLHYYDPGAERWQQLELPGKTVVITGATLTPALWAGLGLLALVALLYRRRLIGAYCRRLWQTVKFKRQQNQQQKNNYQKNKYRLCLAPLNPPEP